MAPKEKARLKMDEMQGQGMGWTEAQFLQRAVEALGECRRTLMYTYVFAYYLDKNGQLEIFEENQSDLEVGILMFPVIIPLTKG